MCICPCSLAGAWGVRHRCGGHRLSRVRPGHGAACSRCSRPSHPPFPSIFRSLPSTLHGPDAQALQLPDPSQGRLPAPRSGAGGAVCLWHDGLRLLPYRPCANAGGLRRGAALAACAWLSGHLRAQHHRHRRQDHPSCRRERRDALQPHRPLHRRHARGRGRARHPAPGPGTACHPIRAADAGSGEPAGKERLRLPQWRRRHALSGPALCRLRPSGRQVAR